MVVTAGPAPASAEAAVTVVTVLRTTITAPVQAIGGHNGPWEQRALSACEGLARSLRARGPNRMPGR